MSASVRILPAVPESLGQQAEFLSNMRGKFTRENPQEPQFQISSHTETETIRRASSSSRDSNGEKRVKCNVLHYFSWQDLYVFTNFPLSQLLHNFVNLYVL